MSHLNSSGSHVALSKLGYFTAGLHLRSSDEYCKIFDQLSLEIVSFNMHVSRFILSTSFAPVHASKVDALCCKCHFDYFCGTD